MQLSNLVNAANSYNNFQDDYEIVIDNNYYELQIYDVESADPFLQYHI